MTTNDLSWGYGKPLGHRLNLSLCSGETVVLLGSNGIGKSALLKTLAGWLPALHGRVTFSDQPLSALSRATIAKHVALLSQHAPTNLQFTVRQWVALGRTAYLSRWGRLTETDETCVEQAICDTALSDKKSTPLSQLSGGELRRAQIAQCLCQRASVLLLDEPTAHLDLSWAHQLTSLLKQLQQQYALGLVFVLHDLALAVQIADRILVLSDQTLHELTVTDVQLRQKLAELLRIPMQFLPKW